MLQRLLLFRVFLYFVLHEVCESSQLRSIDFKSNQLLYRHRTAQFYEGLKNIKDVIIRRGTIFDFRIYLNSNYVGQKIDVMFTFKTMKDKMAVILPSQQQLNWKIQENGKQNYIDVRVQISANAPVGLWQMSVALRSPRGTILEEYKLPNRIIILFNPWSKMDPVYMPNSSLLNEYIFNEKGLLYKNTHPRIPGYRWFFNQFQEGILDAILFLLSKSKLSAAQRGDPVALIRSLKLLVNDDGNKNRGMLKGQWNEPYDTYEGRRATSPMDWTGSAAILTQYYKSGGVPVAYGQCWVFAGLMTTIFRALGIPSRPITTFESGIDHDTDLRIDKHYDARNYYAFNRSDSKWNFHVWNQVWMSRIYDLKNEKYGEWQEVDITPQRVRGAVLQNGPAPTNAVRLGQIDRFYDSDVIYSELNADIVIWRNNQVDEVKTDEIGTSVLTKAVGSDKREEIVRMYKPPEHTAAERESYRKAAEVLGIPAPSIMYTGRSKKKTILVKIIAQEASMIGQPFKITILVKNTSLKPKMANIGIKVTSVYYDGVDGNVILEDQLNGVRLLPMKSKKFDFVLYPNDYIDKLKDFYTSRIEAVATSENGELDHEEMYFYFTTPVLQITAPSKAEIGQAFVVRAHFMNPLDRVLRKCYFIIEGERIDRKIVSLADVAAGEEVAVELKIRSKFPRHETLVISFVSTSLNEVRGSADINIVGKHVNPFGNIKIPVVDI